MTCWIKHPDIKMITLKMYNVMKKIIVIILGFGLLLFTFSSCEETEIKPLPEYVDIQPASWTFGTIDAAVATFTHEFMLTTFEPQSYTVSTVQMNADGFATGTTDMITVDISGEKPNATISGTLNTADVFTTLAVGQEAMIRLTIVSKKGNSIVAVPWQTVTIAQ
jgi:hypothetical protein